GGARRHPASPSSTDYWVNARSGDPLLVITGEVDAALTRALPRLLREVRDVVGERRVTIVFDRGGWSPKLFGTMIKDGFDLLTYRKGRCRQLFWGKAGWRVSASWKIILISQGVRRKRSQPATTSSRCREVHIFLRRGDEGSARPFQHARTLHDVAIVPLAMAGMWKRSHGRTTKAPPDE